MRIIRYNPLHEIEQFFDDPFSSFPAIRRMAEPAMDVFQNEKDLVVELQVPKMDPAQIHVSVEDGILKIEGGDEEVREDSGREYFRKEIRRGSFSRMISLPIPVREDETEAQYENGVLRISIPKVEAKQPKKIEVKVK